MAAIIKRGELDREGAPSYAQAKAANGAADATAATFDANDTITHSASLAGIPVRVASGYDDPFYPRVQAPREP